MRTIRHIATALISSVLFFSSCGSEVQPGAAQDPGATTSAGAAVVEEPELTVAYIDELMGERQYGRVVELLGDSGESGALEPDLAGRLVQSLWVQNEVPRAVRVARATLTKQPDATSISRILTEIYISLDQYGLAVEALHAARQHGAADLEIALTLGVCLGRMEDLAGARAEFERAAEAGVDAAAVDYNLAVLLINDGQHDEAEALLRGVVADQPENLDAQRELARMLLCQHPDQEARRGQAVTYLNIVLDQRVDDWRANELMGDAYMAEGDPEAAVYFYTEALRHGRNPTRVESKYVEAMKARNEMLAAQGLLPQESGQEVDRSGPPIPESVRERMRQAARDSKAQAEEADSGPRDASNSGEDQSQ